MRIQRPPITNVTTQTYASDQQIADFFHTRLERALAKTDGGIAVAFPGGSTPWPILELLVERPLNWSRVAVFPTDERDVDEDHEASNVGKLRAILEPHGALVSPLAEGLDMPHFALVWLGMGADGHIASLFPAGRPDPKDTKAVRMMTAKSLPPDSPYNRFSLTIPSLLACNEMVFVARGQAKRAVFDGALKGDHDLPVRVLLAERQKNVTFPVTCFY
ncbi:MAG: 6-phosphogluconolactonase [Pseudomonadota bacterium]